MIDYEKQIFVDGQILTADCLNRLEKGIENACNAAPPECEVADCSMVLSHGANGCEWVPRIIPANEGGYYTPTINQVDENTLEFTFTPSKSGMAEVPKLTVTLPAGAEGKDGRGIVSVKRTAGTGAPGTNDTYTITYSDDTTSTFTVHNGADGSGSSGGSGDSSQQGATFYPSVDADGNLSWTNNMNLDNPETVNIRGPQGADGASVTHEWNGTTLKVTSASGTSSADLAGPAGADGVGIQEVKMIQTSTEDDGLNVVSMVKTDGTRFQFYVKNGSKGSKGDTIVFHRNLLDNSDFRSPINQRGESSYTGSKYGIDRWQQLSAASSIAINDGFITVSGGKLQQYIETYDADQVYTAAVCDADGNIRILSGRFAAAPTSDYLAMGVGSSGYASLSIVPGTWVWAALYKGAYTADTLPEYPPKGRAEELAECQRYYYKIPKCLLPGYITSNAYLFHSVTIWQIARMRIRPTIKINGKMVARTVAGYSTADGFTTAGGGDASLVKRVYVTDIDCVGIEFASVASSVNNSPFVIAFNGPIELSADL